MPAYFFVLVLFISFPAGAYETLKGTLSGMDAGWRSPGIPLEIDLERSPLDETLFRESLERAALDWQKGPCPAPPVFVEGESDSTAFGVDGVNSIQWIPLGWTGSSAELARTLVTRDATTGEIVDADMVFNLEHYTFTEEGDFNAPFVPFSPVFSHELGHVYGLDHSGEVGTLMTENVTESGISWTPGPDEFGGICLLYSREASDVTSAGWTPPFGPSSPFNGGLGVGLILLGLTIVRKTRWQWTPLTAAVALSLSCHSPTSVQTDAEETSPVYDGSDTLEENPDTRQSDIVQDSGPDVQKESTIPATRSQLEGFKWRVISREYEQPLLDTTISSTGGLADEWWQFDSDGSLSWNLSDSLASCPRVLRNGSWTLENNRLTLDWNVSPIGCEGQSPLRESFSASLTTDLQLHLEQLSSAWKFRNSGAQPLNTQWSFERSGSLDGEDESCLFGQSTCLTSCPEPGVIQRNCEGNSWTWFCHEEPGKWECAGPCSSTVCKGEWASCADTAYAPLCEGQVF